MTEPDYPDFEDLSLRILHGIADDSDRTELARHLAVSSENRARFLDHTALHGLLMQSARAGALADHAGEYFQGLEGASARKPHRLLRFWLPAAAAAVAACLAVVALLPTNANAALDRVIGAIQERRDRSFRIEVIEPAPEQERVRPDRGPYPPANHLNGASLWLRGPQELVLQQSLPNGEARLIGGDGTSSWSMRGNGPVRVSPDPERFGRAIFARNGEIAFLDFRTQLDELKRHYRIEWLDRRSGETSKLIGKRRSDDQGGPREVELWFHPDTGLMERMILRQLPRGNGGPRSIAIILESTAPLPADFFTHESHHEPDRTILTEP